MEVVLNQRSERGSRLYYFLPGNIAGFTLVVAHKKHPADDIQQTDGPTDGTFGYW